VDAFAPGACAPDGAHAGSPAREVNQGAGGFRGVSPPLARPHDAIGDLHYPVGSGAPLNPALPTISPLAFSMMKKP